MDTLTTITLPAPPGHRCWSCLGFAWWWRPFGSSGEWLCATCRPNVGQMKEEEVITHDIRAGTPWIAAPIQSQAVSNELQRQEAIQSAPGGSAMQTPDIARIHAPKGAYPLAQAQEVATRLVDVLRPTCSRIEIAGSIRRQKATVGDIEILCVPKPPPVELFPPGAYQEFEQLVWKLLLDGVLGYRLNTLGHSTYGPLNKLLVHMSSRIPLDLFATSSENWGMAMVVRTGPKDWNVRMMARFRRLDMEGHAYGGVTGPDGEEIACPEEEVVFRLLGWPWSPPELRG